MGSSLECRSSGYSCFWVGPCADRDSNSDGSPHGILSPARLPIPPSAPGRSNRPMASLVLAPRGHPGADRQTLSCLAILADVRVVVLGAGFAGLELTARLSAEFGDEADVVLIDESDAF